MKDKAMKSYEELLNLQSSLSFNSSATSSSGYYNNYNQTGGSLSVARPPTQQHQQSTTIMNSSMASAFPSSLKRGEGEEDHDFVNLRESIQQESSDLLQEFRASLTSILQHPSMMGTTHMITTMGGGGGGGVSGKSTKSLHLFQGGGNTLTPSVLSSPASGEGGGGMDVEPLLEKYSDKLLEKLMEKMNLKEKKEREKE
jgi:hypothetical protein